MNDLTPNSEVSFNVPLIFQKEICVYDHIRILGAINSCTVCVKILDSYRTKVGRPSCLATGICTLGPASPLLCYCICGAFIEAVAGMMV